MGGGTDKERVGRGVSPGCQHGEQTMGRSELRSCVRVEVAVEVAVPGGLSVLTSLLVSVDVKLY